MSSRLGVRSWGVFAFILVLLLLDQLSKYLVKTTMMLGESIRLTDWAYILFTENPGMAFGWEFFDKGFLTAFRIVASGIILWMVRKSLRSSVPFGLTLAFAAIFAGAMGNIIDSVFYGVIYDHSMGQVATLFPSGGGYGAWFHGKVVDMFYFPLVHTVWPQWVPFVGGEELIFFRPIFNFADACISVGVAVLILFYGRSFSHLLSGSSSSEGKEVLGDDSSLSA